jgi:AAA+ superfamily predicted ATPase
MITGIVLIAVAIVVLFFVFNNRSKSDNSDSIQTLSSNVPVIEQSRYDYFLEKYNKAERSIIEKADREILKVQSQIEATSDPTKKLFLQSYVDHYKYDYISRLINFSKYKDEDLTDELDPLFNQAAEKVVVNQKCDYVAFLDWFGYDMKTEKTFHILNQLKDCGIVDNSFEGKGYTVCLKNTSALNNIIRKANGHTLLSREDKLKLNEHFEQRSKELVGDHAIVSEMLTECPEPFAEVIRAYDALSSCNSKWEIVSSQSNTEAKSYANTLVDKKSAYSIYKQTFNFLKPCKDLAAPFFEFKQGGMSFYIYPEFVIAARSATNFEIINIKDFTISFKRQNFVETSSAINPNSALIPKDAKLVRYTYKYVNKNGERDSRYTNNPRYAVYEYGDITFLPYQLTMQFSNSEYAGNFYKKVQMLKNGGNEPVEPNFGATETYFNKVLDVSTPLCNFYDKILQNRKIMLTIDGAITDQVGDAKAKLRFLFLSDLVKCYNQLGHDASNLFTVEGLPMSIVEGHTLTDVNITYNTIQLEQYRSVAESLSKVNKTTKENFLKDKSEDFFYLNEVFKACNAEDLRTQYFSLLYRFFSVIAKADDHITPEEGKWLEMLMSYSTTSKDYGLEVFEKKASVDEKQTKEKQATPSAKSDDETNPLEELQTLIGLSEVKEEVSALANFVKIQQEREKKGMKAVGLSYHCVFTGNPGTGKTTVARILAAIYRDLGILKKGHLVETDRSGLVAEYVGQTAVKTNKIIDSALDGVLFIDEAYSLVQGGGNDYGQEAISTLLKRMEDDRNRLIVVLAGYSEDMKRFIDSNPGLQSRFNRYIHFADYTADELKQIFMLNVEKNQYLLEPEGEELLTKILNFAIEHKDKNFGNGRYVRNLFEKTIQNQAIRLSCQPNITAEELSKLKAEDLPINK